MSDPNDIYSLFAKVLSEWGPLGAMITALGGGMYTSLRWAIGVIVGRVASIFDKTLTRLLDFGDYFKPHIVSSFTAHKVFVETATRNNEKIAEAVEEIKTISAHTMKDIKYHGKVLEHHGVQLEQQGKKIEVIHGFIQTVMSEKAGQ